MIPRYRAVVAAFVGPVVLAPCILASPPAVAADPYERLLGETSVWSQEVDVRELDPTRPAEYRESLGVFPVGNGQCFTYLGLGVPQNTLFMLTGPRYQTDGNHNPMGGFGESSIVLGEGGKVVDLPRQSCRTILGAPVVLVSEEGAGLRLTTVTAAPPGVRAILRWVTVSRTSGERGDVQVALALRGREAKRDGKGAYLEYPHRGRIARLRPVLLGGELEEADGGWRYWVRGLDPGSSHTHVLALLFSESAEDEEEVRLLLEREGPDLLEKTLRWWREKLAPTLRVSSGERRLDDLVEGLKVLLLVQQDAQGGVCPMVNFKGVWLRDSNGPLLGFLGTGLHDEARRLLTYYRQASALHRFTGREFPLDLDVGEDPDLTPEEWAKSGTDRCEVPSFVVLQHRWWLDATGDRSLIEQHWHYLRRNATHQEIHEGPRGPLQTFNGDETYLGGAYYSLFPSRAGYPNGLIRPDAYSADSMLVYVAAQEAMATMARALGKEDEVTAHERLGGSMRESLEKHFWLEDEGRYAPALSPVTFEPHRAPFAPINLRPVWAGYLEPGDPRARRNLDGSLRWLWRPEGLVKMTPFLDHYIGSAPGDLLWSLAAVRHPRAARAFEGLLGSASRSGEWVEVHKPDRPSHGYGDGAYANRLRPWESGLNLDAMLLYLTGGRRKLGREIALDPHLPPGSDRMKVENIPIGRGRLLLEARRDGDGIAYTVSNRGDAHVVVNGVDLAPGQSFAGSSEGPRSPAAEPSEKETYREVLRWAGDPRELIVTAVREAAPEGAQILDAGLPFSPDDLAALLAARPRSLGRIVIHGSALTYDHRTLKPLTKVLEHPAVKRELDAFLASGGQLVIPR